MKNHFKLKFIFYLLPLAITSCISIGVSKDPEPAKNLSYSTPAAPFSDLKSKTGDKAWLSKTTGNTISFISDCSANSDPSLETLEAESLSGIDKLEVIESNQKDYNQRISRETIASGSVDGIAIKIKVISFKKNSCNYNLLFAGKKDKFDSELGIFNNFTESFKAP